MAGQYDGLRTFTGIELGFIDVNASTYSTDSDDALLSVSYTTTGAVTITLQSADVVAGRVLVIKDAGGNATTNNITVNTQGSETIDGASSASITANDGVLRLYSDGTNWFVW